MTKSSIERIGDDAKVRALCERLGCWHEIARQIDNHKSGVVTAQGWVIGFFLDGPVAYRPRIHPGRPRWLGESRI